MSCKAKLFTFLERVAFIKKQKYFIVVTSWLALHWRSQDEPIIYLILSDLESIYVLLPCTIRTNINGRNNLQPKRLIKYWARASPDFVGKIQF